MPTQPVDKAATVDTATGRRTGAVRETATRQTTDDHRDESLGMLFADLSDQVSTLMRREVELAKVETQETITAATGAAVSIMSGGVIAYAGLIIVLQAVAVALAYVIPLWVSGLVVGGIAIVVGAILFMAGRSRMADLSVMPEKTVETVQEDVALVKEKIQ